MRIASWNVNSLRSRLAQVLAWLERERVEVLCLQETKVDDPLFPHAPFAAMNYGAVISGQKAYNGVAILSTLPLEDVDIGFDALLEDEEAERLSVQKRLISARVGGIRVLNLYVPNGAELGSPKYAYKLGWLHCLARYLAARPMDDGPLCMVGDFNIAPEDRDLYAPERLRGRIMASAAERDALGAVLADGLKDVFRRFEQDSGHWSWWDYRSRAWERDRGWRIDHIYLDEPLYAAAETCVMHRSARGEDKPSDHVPVVVTLSPNAAAASGW